MAENSGLCDNCFQPDCYLEEIGRNSKFCFNCLSAARTKAKRSVKKNNPHELYISDAVFSTFVRLNLQLEGLTWEPACGDGQLARVIHRFGNSGGKKCDVYSSDIVEHSSHLIMRKWNEWDVPFDFGIDFLNTREFGSNFPSKYLGKGEFARRINTLGDYPQYFEEFPIINNIVTGPPFSKSINFVQRSLDIAKDKVAMLLRENFQLPHLCPSPTKIISIVGKVHFVCKADDNRRYDGPKIKCAWFVWDKSKRGEPTTKWTIKQCPSWEP